MSTELVEVVTVDSVLALPKYFVGYRGTVEEAKDVLSRDLAKEPEKRIYGGANRIVQFIPRIPPKMNWSIIAIEMVDPRLETEVEPETET